MKRAASGSSPERLVEVFEIALAVLWGRAHQTLGDVTLTAIVNRVLFTAAERFPFMSSLEIQGGTIRCQELGQGARKLAQRELADGIRFVLIELLTVLGNLTAEILTPALHAELSNAAHRSSQGQGSDHGEGTQS